MGGISSTLAAFVYEEPRAALILEPGVARQAIVDTIAVSVAAVNEPVVRHANHFAMTEMKSGPSMVLTTGAKVGPAGAAWLNGVSAHALDYDDVDDLTIGHPSAVLVPSILAIGEAVAATGKDIVDAYEVGLTVMRALASVMNLRRSYQKGWHTTSTLGIFGSVAATGRLLHLDAETIRHALGIAVSYAAGSRQNFGSMTKPIHAGNASAAGVVAGILASRGTTADPEAVDGALGYLELYGDDASHGDTKNTARTERLEQFLSDPPRQGLNIKKHPCCYATHAAADAILVLRPEVVLTDVVGITVKVPEGGLQPLIRRSPISGLEGKFNLPYIVAAGLIGGDLRLATFDDNAIDRPEVKAISQLVHCEEVSNWDNQSIRSGPVPFSAEVTVLLRSGEEFVCRCEAPAGHHTNPLSTQQLQEKVNDCLQHGTSAAANAATSVCSELFGVDSLLSMTNGIAVDVQK